MHTYTIPTYVLAALQERIIKINKQATRLGTPPAELRTLRTFDKETNIDGVLDITRMAEIEFHMDAPKMTGDWQFVAVIEHTDAGNMVHVAPDFRDEQFNVGTATPTCDHCGTTRQRKQTMLVQDSNGQRMRVGGNCLRDFLGHSVPNVWSIWALFDEMIDELDHVINTCNPAFNTWRAFTIACELWTSNGFQPTSFGADSTATKVNDVMQGKVKLSISEQAQQVARDAYDWLHSNEDNSDYMQNLRVALELRDRRHLGLVVSLPNTYMKHLQREQARAAEAKIVRTDCVLGKQTITGTVTKCYVKETDFGSRRVMVVLDDRGFSVWGTVPSAISFVKVGDWVQFNATVEASDDSTFGFFKRPTKATSACKDGTL